MNVLHYTTEDFPSLDTFFRRNLINALSGFKSVNLVGTISKDNITNLAVFSQVFHLGASPALMGMIVRPDTVPRHTLSNLEETGYYTFNHIHHSFYKKAHQSSARYDVSEFEACGLTPEYSDSLPAPYVKESLIKIGLKFEERVNLTVNNTILVIGAVQELFLPQDYVGKDGFIDLEKAGTVTSSGLDSYHLTHRLSRLAYAKPNKELTEMPVE